MIRPLIFSLPGNESLSTSLVRELDAELGAVEIRRFPDGESYVRIRAQVSGRECLLVATLDRPDDKIMPLSFLASTARELGAARVTLIAPYLAYMRQDRRFQPGESVTSAYFARFLSGWIDGLVTVDPHLHRRSSLEEIYTVPCTTLHAAPLISRWIREEVEDPLIVGPDVESEQWVSEVAKEAGSPWVVLKKERLGDREVRISVPDLDRWSDRTPVLVDDIISTARTMIETVAHLVRSGLEAPVCVGVHGIFAGSAHAELRAAGTSRIVTCNNPSRVERHRRLYARLGSPAGRLILRVGPTGNDHAASTSAPFLMEAQSGPALPAARHQKRAEQRPRSGAPYVWTGACTPSRAVRRVYRQRRRG